MKKRYYILLGIISYLFFTLGNIPAAKVISLVDKNTAIPAKLYGVYGTIWNGGADKAMIQGQPSVDNIKWSINPASLLLARIGGEVKGIVKEQNIIGNFSISASGKISASDIRARIEAPVMQELLQLPFGELGGTFNVTINSLEIEQQQIPSIIADINWKNAKLTLAETVDLGNINLSVKQDNDDQLSAVIKNTKGQLLLDGNATVDNKKSYTLNLRITPEKNATDNIRQSITMFARRQTDGSYLVKRKGNLREFGL